MVVGVVRVFAVVVLAARAASALEEPRALESALEPIRASASLPALGAAVASSRGLEAIGAVGRRSVDAPALVTRDDLWHVGSCTKAITATLAARLVERGLLRWDTTIGEVLGPSIPSLHDGWKRVTIASLLAHRSGASKNFPQDLWERMVARGGSVRAQRKFFVREGLAAPPEKAPDTETIYSNAGFVVAGAMLEQLADEGWEDLVRREVFEPLGMSASGFGAPGTPALLDQPLGHRRAATGGFAPVRLGPGADIPAAGGPAGTVHVTLADWARFASAHLRGERGDESYLKQAQWEKLHAPLAGGEYALGWVVVPREEWAGGRVLRHLGSNEFWIAEISLAPEKDLAVMIVTNVADDAAEKPFRETLSALTTAAASGK